MKFKITITDHMDNEEIFVRESKYENFFDALDNDLPDIWELIKDDNCMWYDWEELIE